MASNVNPKIIEPRWEADDFTAPEMASVETTDWWQPVSPEDLTPKSDAA